MGISCRPPSSRRRFRRVNTRLGSMTFLIIALAMAVFLPSAVSRAKEQKSSLIAKIRNLKDQLTNSVVQVKHLIPAPSAPWHPVTVVPDAFHLEWTTSGQWHFPNYSAPLLRTKAGESAMISLYTHCTPVRPAPVGGKPTVLEAYKPIWSCKVYYSETNPALPNAPEGVLAVLGTDYTWERLCTPTWIFDPQVPSFSTDEVFQFTPLKAGYWQVCPTLASVQKIKPATNVNVGDPVTVDQSEDGLPVVIGCTLDLVVIDPLLGAMPEEPAATNETNPGAVTNCYSNGIPIQLNFKPADYPNQPFDGTFTISAGDRNDVQIRYEGQPFSLSEFPCNTMIGQELALEGIGPNISPLTLTWTLERNGENFLSDSATISFDELDLVIDNVADPRNKATQQTPDEENPGVLIPLNTSFEKDAVDTEGDSVEDYAAELRPEQADCDPQMKPVNLQWLKSGSRITSGWVKFSNIQGTPSNYISENNFFQEIPGAPPVQSNYRIWAYLGQLPRSNPEDPNAAPQLVNLWRAIPPDTWVPIPEDESQQAFYIEAIGAGQMSTITATYMPNDQMPDLTFADAANVVTPRIDILEVPKYLFASAKYWTPIRFKISPVLNIDQINQLTAQFFYGAVDQAGNALSIPIPIETNRIRCAHRVYASGTNKGEDMDNTTCAGEYEGFISPDSYNNINANICSRNTAYFSLQASVTINTTQGSTAIATDNDPNAKITMFMGKSFFAVDMENNSSAYGASKKATVSRTMAPTAFVDDVPTMRYEGRNIPTNWGCNGYTDAFGNWHRYEIYGHADINPPPPSKNANNPYWTNPPQYLYQSRAWGPIEYYFNFAKAELTNTHQPGTYTSHSHLRQTSDNTNTGLYDADALGQYVGVNYFISYGGRNTDSSSHLPTGVTGRAMNLQKDGAETWIYYGTGQIKAEALALESDGLGSTFDLIVESGFAMAPEWIGIACGTAYVAPAVIVAGAAWGIYQYVRTDSSSDQVSATAKVRLCCRENLNPINGSYDEVIATASFADKNPSHPKDPVTMTATIAARAVPVGTWINVFTELDTSVRAPGYDSAGFGKVVDVSANATYIMLDQKSESFDYTCIFKE